MVESLSSAPDFITSPELEEDILNGRTTTFTIWEESLPDYLEAADMTDFEVTRIAEPGQYYITDQVNPVRRKLKADGQENKTPIITAGKSQDPIRKGDVGISLKRPPGVTDDTDFYRHLRIKS